MALMPAGGTHVPIGGRRVARRLVSLFVVAFVVLGAIAVHEGCMEALGGRAAGARAVDPVAVNASTALSDSDHVPSEPPCHQLDEADRVTPPAPSFLLLMVLFLLGFAWWPGPAASPWRVLRSLSRGRAGARSPIALCVIRV
jgi:hypothetical protein